MKKLIEDYKRRLATVNEMIEKYGHGNGSINDIRRTERLNTKASEFRTFIAEMERAEASRNTAYFKIVPSSQSDRIEIECGRNGRLFLINTPEGVMVDVYANGEDEIIDTMCIWDEDMNNVVDFTDDLSEDEQPNACKQVIHEVDVLSVANKLKMEISEERINEILEAYDDYRKQYPDDSWYLIVEDMLYNFLPK